MRVTSGIGQREECKKEFKKYAGAEGLEIDLDKELYIAEEIVYSMANATHGRHLTLTVDTKRVHRKAVTCEFGQYQYQWEIETSDRERRWFMKDVLEYVPESQLEHSLDMVESGLSSQNFHRDENIVYGIANMGDGDICAFVSHPKGSVNDFNNSKIYKWKSRVSEVVSGATAVVSILGVD